MKGEKIRYGVWDKWKSKWSGRVPFLKREEAQAWADLGNTNEGSRRFEVRELRTSDAIP